MFASSPQPNPYKGILQKLSVGTSNYSYYNLPALKDPRIGTLITSNINHREIAIFNQNIVGICCQEL